MSTAPSSRSIRIGPVPVGGGAPLVLIAGPCVIESASHAAMIATRLKELCARVSVPLVFKASFDKANRTSLDSYRGPGLAEGIAILAAIKRELNLPVITDVHETSQVGAVAEVADCLQIPALLCRQTDLLLAAGAAGRAVNVKKGQFLAAGATGRAVNVKKGQFLAPNDLRFAVEKVESTGNRSVLVTERGTTFGYGDLVVDFRSIGALRATGCPVVFDATHSVQRPGGETTGGTPAHIPSLARAAIAVGIDALFMEVHERPSAALSDGPNAMHLDALEPLLLGLVELDHARRRIFGDA